jgi:hypothetical protein
MIEYILEQRSGVISTRPEVETELSGTMIIIHLERIVIWEANGTDIVGRVGWRRTLEKGREEKFSKAVACCSLKYVGRREQKRIALALSLFCSVSAADGLLCHDMGGYVSTFSLPRRFSFCINRLSSCT